MTLWRRRILIPAASVALAGALGLWYERLSDDWRRRIIADEADMAADILSIHAIAEYATNLVTLPAWVTIAVQTSATPVVWGGYHSITASFPVAMGPDLSGVYTFAARSSVLAECAPDRGWFDSYTNAAGRRLLDLGPAGGGYRGQRVGGWVLPRASAFYAHHAIPRGYGLTSGWFLAQQPGYDLAVGSYSPYAIAIAPGSIDPARVTYWYPPTLLVETNAIRALPLRSDLWLPAATHPVAIYPARSPWERDASPAGSGLADALDDILYDHVLLSNTRYWVDPAYAANPNSSTSFDGWTNSLPPSILYNDTFLSDRAAYAAIDPATNLLASWQATVAALGHLSQFRAFGLWTNGWRVSYYSRAVSGYYYTVPALLAALQADPQWTLTSSEATDGPPGYAFHIGVYEDWPTWQISAIYECTIGQPFGLLGIGHGTNRYPAVTAHTWATAYPWAVGTIAIPPAETLVASGALRTVITDSSVAGPDHLFETFVPSFTNAPPAAWWPTNISLDGLNMGYTLANPIIVAAPAFE